MKKRISSILICFALLLSVIPTSVLAVEEDESKIEAYTYVMLSSEHTEATDAWKDLWSGHDMDKDYLYVYLDGVDGVSPKIEFSEDKTVLTYAFPSLEGWKCVSSYMPLIKQLVVANSCKLSDKL